MKWEDTHVLASFWAGIIDIILRFILGWEVLGMFGISLISYSLLYSYIKASRKKRK